MSEAREATRGSGIKLATEAVGRVLSVVATFLVAAGLGVEGFGVFSALSGVAVLAAELGDLGLQGLTAPALVSGRFRLEDLRRAKWALTALLALLAVSLHLAAATALPPLLALVSPAAPGGGGGAAAGLLLPLILYYGASGWIEWQGVALRALGRRGEEAAVLLLMRAATLVAVAAALARSPSVGGVAWAQAFSTVPAFVLGAWRVRRLAPGAAPAATVRQALAAAWPLAVNGALALLSLRLELLLLFFWRGSREAGLFGAALKLVESLNAVPAAVVAGALPSLTREAAPADRRPKAVRGRTAGTVALLATPAALGLALCSKGLVLVLGAAYAEAAVPLRVLAFSLLPLFMNTVLLSSLIAAGRADALPRLTGARVGAAAALALVLVPALGAPGAAAGFVAAELLLTALAARACGRARFAIPVIEPLAVAALVSIPMALAVAAAGPSLPACLGTGLLCYALTLGAAWKRLPPLRRILGLTGNA